MLRIRPRLGFFLAAAALWAASDASAAIGYDNSVTLMSDGNMLLVGGMNSAGAPLATVSIYVSTEAATETRAPLNVARASHTATLLPDGRVLVTGGVTGGPAVRQDGELYDPRTNAWTATVNNMAVARFNHTATLLPNGLVLIAGGQTDTAGTVTASCDLFNPATNGFGACGAGGAMQMARAAHTSTLLHNGRVFAAGGYRGPGNGFSPTTEIYDPATDSWSAGPALIQARAWHTATQMGNQRVLIAGGANSINFKGSQGFLETTEIYDPNSDTIAPAAPMESRKMFHTAVLSGGGKVDIYGGLGNITTSYYTTGINFDNVSTLAVTAVPGTWLNATIAGASGLHFTPDITLSVPAYGRVVDGDVNFSSPTVVLADAKAFLDYPDQTKASLAGALTNKAPGEINSQLTLTQFSGKVTFFPQKVTSADVLLSGGSLVTGVNPIVPGTTYNLTGASSLSGTIQVPMQSSDVNGQVIAGAAIITAGSISLPSSNSVQGWDVKLTSGVAQIAGNPTVVNDPINGPILVANVTFTGVQGTITDSTTTNEATPINPTGQKLTSLAVQFNYVVSPINLSNTAFTYDIATVTIRSMIFGQQEQYNPSKNSWTFNASTGAILFNHATALAPNGDERYFGGRACVDFPSCSAFSYTAQFVEGVFFLEGLTWTSAGSLNQGRANHTLTLLPDGRALAAGGHNASNALCSAELFDSVARTWTQTSDLKTCRSHHTATLLTNGNVLATGGFTTISQSTGTTNKAEVFYPATNAWVPTAPMVSSRAYHSTVLLPNGNVFVMGGFLNGSYLSSTEVYIATAATWLAGPPIGSPAEPRAQFAAAVLRDGRVLVIGGINATGILNTSKIFDPRTWSWSNGPSLNIPRHSHTATLLRDGRVLVVGGDSGVGIITDGYEIYDPVLNQFTLVALVDGNSGQPAQVGRTRHTAVLLPDGRVLAVGGYQPLGGTPSDAEGFDLDAPVTIAYGPTQAIRGDATTIVLKDGNVLDAGGFDGLNYSAETDTMYYGDAPDAVTLAGGQPRLPSVTGVSPAAFLPGALVTATGGNFRGVTEASGGGAASANSSFAHPRLYMQRTTGGSASNGDSGWMIDLTSGIYNSGVNNWSKMDSSLTFTVPYTSATLPLGWYQVRVAANAQFSPSYLVRVAPPAPTAVPGIPFGTPVGPSSITWTWGAAAGQFDGYAVYSATSGVFIATVARSGGGVESFLQTGLGPDTSSLIQVAAYNVGGDGQVVAATNPVNTAISGVNGLKGIAQSPLSIFWSWNPVSGANSYQVFSASNSQPLGTVLSPAFTQTGLSTNTAYGIQVQAAMPGGPGFLSASASAYTLAAQPLPNVPPVVAVTTGSLVAQWLRNTNPAGTLYELRVVVNSASSTAVDVSSIVGLTQGIYGGTPNTLYTLSIAAENGDGVFTSFTSLGSTYTLANPPLNAVVTAAGPSFVSIQWGPNGNPGNTPYQLLYSNDNFVTNLSTFIAFSANYTTTTATISPLLTAQTYTMRVTAINGFGAQTAAASTQAFTTNGGGPPGSLTFTAAATNYSSLDGTLSSTTVTRRFTMTVPANAFTADTQIFVSTLSAFNCGGIPVGVSIVNSPSLQPKLPLDIAIQYYPGDPNLGPLATLGMVRYDPVSGACVPLLTMIDTTNSLVHAKINHFSNYQLMQIVPQASSGLGLSRIFPNPFNASRQSYVTFDRLPANARIRVYTIHGEVLVDVPTNASGIATWNGTNTAGRPVASGIYLVEIQSGGDKTILKLVVIR